LRGDENKTYEVEPAEMFRIIDNRALIPGDLQHKKEELHQYVNHFKDEKSGKINYEGLVQDLN